MPRKEIVFLIQGVNPGPWPTVAMTVLSPHFQCEWLPYHEYDHWWGPIKAVFNIPVLAITSAAMGTCFWLIRSPEWLLLIIEFIVALIGTVIAVTVARFQRQRCADRLKADMDDRLRSTGPRPHVIAHSLGTWMSMTILFKFLFVHFDRVVLVGNILRRRFDWEGLLNRKPEAFRDIRAELGASDWVVRLAAIAGLLPGDIGGAGVWGFKGPSQLVHTIPDPTYACGQCLLAGHRQAGVHNVPLGGYGHSDVFLGKDHCHQLWLPFLWGFPPHEFIRYEDLCSMHVSLRDKIEKQVATPGDKEDFLLVHRELLTREWSWLGASLEKHIESRLSRLSPSTRNDIASVVGRVADYVVKANDERASEEVARRLHPLEAIRDAI
jgi:hypothetical protein